MQNAIQEQPLTIYDVLRVLVNMQTWKDENSWRRVHEAINNAEKDKVFGTEGKFEL